MLNSVRILCSNFCWISSNWCKLYVLFDKVDDSKLWINVNASIHTNVCYNTDYLLLSSAEYIARWRILQQNYSKAKCWVSLGNDCTRYVVCSIWYGFINGQDIQKCSDKKITHIVWVLLLSFHSMVKRAPKANVKGKTLLSEFLFFDSFIILKFEIND